MNKRELPKLDWKRINALIDMAIEEDVKTGDATSVSVVPEGLTAQAQLVVREKCVCAGLEIAKAVFQKLDPSVTWKSRVKDGDVLAAGAVLATIEGNARSMLTAERIALNFLQRLSGIATKTRRYIKALKKSKTKILDTRKTIPAWRNLEKYAVAAGGGTNHRFGLYDRIMIKDNHRALAELEGKGGIIRSVKKAREVFPNLEVEVEADNLNEVKEAIKAGADYILLDNMTNKQMKKAVKINKGRSKLEASGGITIKRISSIAKLGLDYISVGAITHSAKAVDIAMDINLH